MLIDCLQCKVRVSTRAGRKFCSRVCAGIFKRGKPNGRILYAPPKNTKICEHCEKEYQPNNGRQRICFVCVPKTDEDRARAYRYGLSKELYDRFVKEQNSICALCPKNIQVIDHDHKTGLVRGLLCSGCNSSLNRVELQGWLEKALQYLAKPQHPQAKYRRKHANRAHK